MSCKYCENYDTERITCRFISLAPKPYKYIVGGGCYAFDCAYSIGGSELTGKCPLCSCKDPEYPNGKIFDGCPACSEVTSYGTVKRGSFCESGVRIIEGIEYPNRFDFETSAEKCAEARPRDGAWYEALNGPVAWYMFGRLRKKLIPFLDKKYKFCKDGNLKSTSERITLEDFIRSFNEAIKKDDSIGKYAEKISTLMMRDFSVEYSKYTKCFYRSSFWRKNKKENNQ